MTTLNLEADYLVVGAGAMAMAFIDTLLVETQAQVLVVDRHHRPGGFWNDTYPFVRLEQPALFYGVASLDLGRGAKDPAGLNAGLYSGASWPELLAYFDQVMQERFLPSGRVRWLPMCEHLGQDGTAHVIRSRVTGAIRQVPAVRKLVDATHTRTALPSTDLPGYPIAPEVSFIAVNGLAELRRGHARYTLLGGGKTSMDACLWLLENGVDPAAIRWIMPREPWLQNRFFLQPGPEYIASSLDAAMRQYDAVLAASSVPHLFAQLEQGDLLLRIDPSVPATAYRNATVSPAELRCLRRVTDVLRMGHVQAIEGNRIQLEGGAVPADPDTLYVDCSAHGCRGPVPQAGGPRVFVGDRINLLRVQMALPTLSAAMIAHVEAHVADPEEKNRLCSVVPIPDQPLDWLRVLLVSLENRMGWMKDDGLRAWLTQCRLNPHTAALRGVDLNDRTLVARLQEFEAKGAAVMPKLRELLKDSAQ
jgi:hypothetical protein